jgi:hypothetical protein
MRGLFTRIVLPSAATVALFALATVPSYAINPQPLPPREDVQAQATWSSSISRVTLNPQPLPPRIAREV